MAKTKDTPIAEKTQISERSLPADINAEAALLSAMLIDSEVVSKGLDKLREEFFYRKANKLIFRTMQELFSDNIEIDALTLINRLQRNNLLEKVGGVPYINELVDFVVSSANFDYHFNIVWDQALLRQMILTCNQIIETCYSANKPVRTIVDEAEQSIFAIAEIPKHQGFQRIGELTPEVVTMIDKVASTRIPMVGVSSGFGDLDKMTGGFRAGQFVIIAARPAMGKSAFALNMASYAAVNLNKKVAVFTMEMSAEELILRLFSTAAEVSVDSMLKGFGMNEERLTRIQQAADALSSKHIYIDDSGTNSPLEIRAKTRRLQAELGGLDLVIIDYIQLMTSTKPRDNRQQEISEISRALKIMAKDLHLPVIALSQLNRMLENREDKRPRLADLRESGAIEQDADLVMFIYRDEYYNPEKTQTPGIAEIIIGKNRHGQTGFIELGFAKEYTQFRSIDTSHEF